MLDAETKQRIDKARNILVGKLPNPMSQVEQITIALIYKFMDDMDAETEEMGGPRTFFSGEFERYGWAKLMDVSLGGNEMLNRYAEGIEKMNQNPNIPAMFRNIFKNAYLPYRDPETLKLFLKTINGFRYDHSENLGDAFEYLLSALGSQGDAGQFRTPRHIIDFMVQLVDPKKEERVLDPACGTAGFLISAFRQIMATERENAKIGEGMTPDERKRLMGNFEGYDISPEMVRISLVNMFLHGFQTPKIIEYDTLTSEERWGDFADVILANPPFMSPTGGIRPHKRFSIQSNRSEVLFVDYIMEHLTPNGRAAVIVPEGIIFQGGKAYKALRKKLVEEDYLVGVISLPAGVFNPYSGVKTSILWMDRALAKKTDKVIFCKVEHDGFDLGAQRRANGKNDMPGALAAMIELKVCLVEGRESTNNGHQNVSLVDKKLISKDGEFGLNGERFKPNKHGQNQKWNMVSLGDICHFVNGLAFKPNEWEKEEENGLPIIRIQNLNNPNSDFHYYSLPVPEKNYVNNGDLLFSWSGSKGTSFGAHIWQGKRGILNQHIFRVIHSETVIKDFLLLALNEAVAEIEENLHGGVGLVHITKGDLEKIKIPVPPLGVQKEIVQEIEGYQKIIDGARMVVDNYRPRIEVDPSWPVVKLGEVCETSSGGTPLSTEKSFYENGSIPWLTSGEVAQGFILQTKDKITEKGLQNSSAKLFPVDTVLVAMYGATAGKVGILKIEATTNQAVCGILPCDHYIPDFLYFYLKGLSKQLLAMGTGGAQPNISQKIIRNLDIPLPNLEIQNEIVENMKNEVNLINSTNTMIELYVEKIRARMAKVWGE